MLDKAGSTFGKVPEFQWIDVDLLQVDKRYQREISDKSQRNIAKIVREFNWSKFQVLIISGPDKIGDYSVIDGQHRLEAARRLGTIEKLPCVIVDALEIKQQAETFVSINKDRTAVSPIQRFWAEVAAHDPNALKVKTACEEAGMMIGRTSGGQKPGATIAIRSVRKALQLGREKAIQAMSNLVKAQGDVPNAMKGQVIYTLAIIHTLNDVNDERMISVLRERDFESDLEEVRRFKKSLGGQTEFIFATAIAKSYNKGLSAANRIIEEYPVRS